MSRLAKHATIVVAAFFIFGSSFTPAFAACKKMGFLVNDYGKEGPTSDAQVLLDKHIAAWADKQGIEEYSVGKKAVKCELFLDFIVFDEHTCTATATVCWGGSKQPKVRDAKAKKNSKTKSAKAKAQSKTKKAVAKAPAKKTPVVKTVATKVEKIKPSNTRNVETSALPEKANATSKASSSPAVPYAKGAVIRSSDERAPSVASPSVPKAKASQAKTAAVASERAAADRAAEAAERAAAAAERAAAAAQLAAEAAKQAAAAGQASQSAVVAPVKPTNTP